MWAAIGSAVGLGSIWRFPYVVGQNGGAVFVLLFCIFLLAVSLPIMLSEIVIGRKTQSNPSDAFEKLGSRRWKVLGTMQVVTGFLVSVFYSVVCAWTLGYLLESLSGSLLNFSTAVEAKLFWESCLHSVSWVTGAQIGFLFLAGIVLFAGVQKGIEATNKILMPLLFFMLLFLAIVGLSMDGAKEGLRFLFSPDWSMLNGKVALLALGQACFGLSVGQGTMITYGSYLKERDNLFKISLPVTLAVVVVSLLAGIAIFTAVFSVGGSPQGGAELFFQTLPMIFSTLPFGGFFCFLFFLLILFAGLTSQISAMEPLIAYLIDHKTFSRHKAALVCCLLVFALSLPISLSFGALFTYPIFDLLSFLCVNFLVPLGALAAVILIGWKNPFSLFMAHLDKGLSFKISKSSFATTLFSFAIKYLAPVVIFIIILSVFYAR
ncbi:sodium-dependent transporter [bacterium]|nr:sodium-dependent transporter [bacterium]